MGNGFYACGYGLNTAHSYSEPVYYNDPAYERTRYCDGCNGEFNEDNLTWSDGEWRCDDCLAEAVKKEFVEDYEDCLTY